MSHKKTVRESSSYMPTVAGVSTAIVVCLTLTTVLVSFVLKKKLSDQFSDMPVLIIHTVSVLIGCIVGTSFLKGNFLKTIFGIGGAYIVITGVVGAIVTNVSFIKITIGLIAVIAGCVLALLIRMRPTRKLSHKSKYTRV